MKKTTMADIARLAGVSPSAVSFALNDREGISAETRSRILRIASDQGWFPNAAARALTGSRVGAIGLVLTRPPHTLGNEPFYMTLFAGLEKEFSTTKTSLLMHIAADEADELDTYRRWQGERRVDGVVLLDLKVNDVRPGILADLGVPVVVVGDPQYAGGRTAVWSPDAEAIRSAVARLVELGHRRLARVSERSEMAHTVIRTTAFLDACVEHDLPSPIVVTTDATAAAGQAVSEQLFRAKRPPTAVIFDNDVMAVAALRAARLVGVRVPADVSLIAYDDSVLCQVTDPPLAAISHDVYEYGRHIAGVLLRQLDSAEALPDELDTELVLVERESLGPAPSS